ncbi:hypothetical protein B0H12DRAFT_1228654 [Mycena haematopus]|nr:hypothetical protein B0H12DRAFT_1228654 [Mycena haematopus]
MTTDTTAAFDVSKLDKTARRMLSGKTPFFASTLDPRFSFGMYIPAAHSFDAAAGRLPLLVLIHGTRRDAQTLLAGFASFAEAHGVAVLAPLFPAGVVDAWDVHNYKGVVYRPSSGEVIRFDEVLLSMVGQAAGMWRVEGGRFWMHGFSGGGQFVHRFVYLWAGRVCGASVGAPGAVTLDTGERWPRGVGDVEGVFGVRVDWEEIRRVQMVIVVGERDTDASGIGKDERAGKNRLERARYLHSMLVGRGVAAELAVVPGMGHEGTKCIGTVQSWLGRMRK